MELETFNGGGSTLKPEETVGHLLLVWATDYIAHSPTKFTTPGKPSDVIVVDVVDLSTNQMGIQSWWRNGRLIRDLKPKIGKPNPVLVMMHREVAGPGNPNPPYELIPMGADQKAVAIANAWFQVNPTFTPSGPTPPRAEIPVQPAVLNSEPGQPDWMPAAEHWTPPVINPAPATRANPVYVAPAPTRPLTQAERMAQSEEAPF